MVRAISCGQTTTLECSLTGTNFNMSPNTFDVNQPPVTVTLTGAGLNTAYGMPTVEYYDEYGTYRGQVTAIAVASDNSWIQAVMPDLTGAYSGSYTLVVTNATWDQPRSVVGTAVAWLYGNDPPLPEPYPDPCLYLPMMECGPVY